MDERWHPPPPDICRLTGGQGREGRRARAGARRRRGALIATTTKVPITIGGRELALTNLNKVLFPEAGLTKGDLIAYYRSVAAHILPHLSGRPLTLERYPNGVGEPGWWEKSIPRGMPGWIPTVTVPSEFGKRSEVAFPIVEEEAALAYFANLAAVTLHVWMSKQPELDRPDYFLIDLDPFGCTLATLARVALLMRETTEAIGLVPLVKTTGGSGMHLIVPLEPRYDYETVKAFGELLARRVHDADPSLTTLERTIGKRRTGTVYLDYVQVGRGKTIVPPFAVRARPTAPVSMPLFWEEVEAMRRKRAKDTVPEMGRWTIRTAAKRLQDDGDPWAGKWNEQRLEPALARARTLWE